MPVRVALSCRAILRSCGLGLFLAIVGFGSSCEQPSSQSSSAEGSAASNNSSPADKAPAFVAPGAASQAPPPPPPPPPAEPAATATKPRAPALADSARKKVAAKPVVQPKKTSNCGGECVGAERVTVELQRNLRAKAGLARSCYNRALSENDTALTGNLTVNVRVGKDGAACSASIGADTLGNASVSRCVTQRFLSGTFPKPKGGCVDVAIPINFVSQ